MSGAYIQCLCLFDEGDTTQSSTDKPLAIGFQIELEFENAGSFGGG